MTAKIAISVAFIVMTVVTFLMFALDKAKSKGKGRRIPEAALLSCSFLLGGVGGLLGMVICRHKTAHWYFCVLVPLFAVLSASALAAAFFLL